MQLWKVLQLLDRLLPWSVSEQPCHASAWHRRGGQEQVMALAPVCCPHGAATKQCIHLRPAHEHAGLPVSKPQEGEDTGAQQKQNLLAASIGWEV